LDTKTIKVVVFIVSFKPSYPVRSVSRRVSKVQYSTLFSFWLIR